MGGFIVIVIIAIAVWQIWKRFGVDYSANENPTSAVEQYNLGQYYAEKASVLLEQPGFEYRPYAKKAFYWYTKAARQGHADAQCEVGDQYICGSVCRANKRKARYWLTKAAEQGHERAKDHLITLDSDYERYNSWCYIATSVYGSYDCPEVWTLRRFRDSKLSASWFGRRFIQIYYAVSPKVVKLFGNKMWFNRLCKSFLNKIVHALQNSGIDSGPYLGK